MTAALLREREKTSNTVQCQVPKRQIPLYDLTALFKPDTFHMSFIESICKFEIPPLKTQEGEIFGEAKYFKKCETKRNRVIDLVSK